MALAGLSSLLGGRLRVVVVALVVLGLVVGGAYALGVVGAPTVDGVENRFAGVNETTTVVETDLVVSNPNPVGVGLEDLTVAYAVDMNGLRMASGTKTGVSVSTGESRVPFTTHMANERIPAWWVSHVRNDEHTDLVVHADVHSGAVEQSVQAPAVRRSIDTDLLSAFNTTESRPVNASAPVVSDPVLYVNETSAHWGTVNRSVTEIELDFTVYNPKSYPVGVSKLGYDITMNNLSVGAGETEQGYVVAPKSTETIETTVRIRNEKLDEWWVTHLERDQRTTLRIDFYADLEVSGGQSIRVPLDALTYTETMETDLFGNKDGDAGSTDETTETGTASGTSGDGDGTSTASRTGSTTAAETATASDGETTAAQTTADGETTAAPPPTTDDGGLLGDSTETPTGNETTTDDGLFGSFASARWSF